MNRTINVSKPHLRSITLPPELWLHILENTSIYDAKHLWTQVRHVSRQFRDFVERLFFSTYLPKFAISLSLPKRNPTTGALKWPGAPIPGAQIVFSYDGMNSQRRSVVFRSPLTLHNGSNVQTVEALRNALVLPVERLQAAPPWVFFNKNPMTGLSMSVPAEISWDDDKKTWVWRVEWRRLLTQFYRAKEDLKCKTMSLPIGKSRAVRRGGRR